VIYERGIVYARRSPWVGQIAFASITSRFHVPLQIKLWLLRRPVHVSPAWRHVHAWRHASYLRRAISQWRCVCALRNVTSRVDEGWSDVTRHPSHHGGYKPSHYIATTHSTPWNTGPSLRTVCHKLTRRHYIYLYSSKNDGIVRSNCNCAHVG